MSSDSVHILAIDDDAEFSIRKPAGGTCGCSISRRWGGCRSLCELHRAADEHPIVPKVSDDGGWRGVAE